MYGSTFIRTCVLQQVAAATVYEHLAQVLSLCIHNTLHVVQQGFVGASCGVFFDDAEQHVALDEVISDPAAACGRWKFRSQQEVYAAASSNLSQSLP